MTKVLTYGTFSDPHGMLPDPASIPVLDFLFIGGDIFPYTNHSLGFQYEWGKYTLGPWLEEVNKRVKHIVGICGNHDFIGQTPYGKVVLNGLPWTYLQDKTVRIEGVKIHGSPWSPTFFDWAFMDSDWQLGQYWSGIPANGLDVLMVHGPPHGVLDRIPSGEHVGSESLALRLTQIAAPQVAIYGHIHSARGIHGGIGPIPLSVNACLVDEDYEPVNDLFLGELTVKGAA